MLSPPRGSGKIVAIARRELLAAVKTKAFLLTIVMMPVLMGISLAIQDVSTRMEREKEKVYAIVDRSPGQRVGKSLAQAFAGMQAMLGQEPELRGLIPGKTTIEVIEPAGDDDESIAQQRFDISQKIEKGQYEALIEIGPRAAEAPGLILPGTKRKFDDDEIVRYQAKGVGALQFRRVVEAIVNQVIQMNRFQDEGVPMLTIARVQQPVPVKARALTRFDAEKNTYVDGREEAQVVNLILPAVLVMLMFMIVMIGATPAMHGVVEEKSQRIAEVLLGSVTPFQLMAGKLLGIVGVSLILAAVYLGGGFFLASSFGVAELLSVGLMMWFVAMLLLALLIFGSLFIAVGAAASDVKDTQTLLMPIMTIACLPLFALGPIIQDPNGPIARACTMFPFAAPMLLVARESTPPGVPLGEMAASITVTLLTTFLCVWAAGRIFRIGILSHGKAPTFREMARWITRG